MDKCLGAHPQHSKANFIARETLEEYSTHISTHTPHTHMHAHTGTHIAQTRYISQKCNTEVSITSRSLRALFPYLSSLYFALYFINFCVDSLPFIGPATLYSILLLGILKASWVTSFKLEELLGYWSSFKHCAKKCPQVDWKETHRSVFDGRRLTLMWTPRRKATEGFSVQTSIHCKQA